MMEQPDVDTFSLESAKAALEDILFAFTSTENEQKMKVAQDNAGNDLLMMMQLVFPVAVQIQTEVIPKYGFTEDGNGIVQFTKLIKKYEKQSETVRKLNAELKSIVMPICRASERGDSLKIDS